MTHELGLVQRCVMGKDKHTLHRVSKESFVDDMSAVEAKETVETQSLRCSCIVLNKISRFHWIRDQVCWLHGDHSDESAQYLIILVIFNLFLFHAIDDHSLQTEVCKLRMLGHLNEVLTYDTCILVPILLLGRSSFFCIFHLRILARNVAKRNCNSQLFQPT